jgi:N-acetyl-anhydromuramyl-L-alanine amidase AmpD
LSIDTSYPCHPSNFGKGRTRPVEEIIVHYTGGTGSALANVRYYNSVALPSGSKASAHFFVGHAAENAQIYQSVDPKDTAYHAVGGNSNSIGIEICCHNDTSNKSAASRDWYFDPEMSTLLRKLIKASWPSTEFRWKRCAGISM